MVHENSLKNLKTDPESTRKAAQSKKGMQYYTTRIKERYVKSKHVQDIPITVAKRIDFLTKELCNDKLTKKKRDSYLDEIKALSTLFNKFQDKTFATQFESDNKHDIGSVIINTVKPDTDE